MESCVSSVKTASTDTIMIDAIFFWHFVTETLSAFVSIAQYILPSVQQQAVILIFSKMYVFGLLMKNRALFPSQICPVF